MGRKQNPKHHVWLRIETQEADFNNSKVFNADPGAIQTLGIETIRQKNELKRLTNRVSE